MVEWYVNPVIDTIYGEAEATGLLERMVLNTPIKGIGDATSDNYNAYLSMIYHSAMKEFGYINGIGGEMKNAAGPFGGLWVRRINKLYQEKYGVKNVFSKQALIKYAVFFGYLLCSPEDQNLNVGLSEELDELVGRIAGPGEKYNTKVYMNDEMFQTILIYIYDLPAKIGPWGGNPKSLWATVTGYPTREKNPYNEYIYPSDFFIQGKYIDINTNWIKYPYMMNLAEDTPRISFMNWNKTNPFDV